MDFDLPQSLKLDSKTLETRLSRGRRSNESMPRFDAVQADQILADTE